MNSEERSPIMTLNYFAYGSNMLTARLRRRCIFPYKVERAYVDDRIIEFSKRSKDCSGKATLRKQAGHRTPGVLFRIPITDSKKLDRFEGAGKGKGYSRCDEFPVHLTRNDDIVCATTYLATYPEPGIKPYDWYLALVIAGVLEHDLGAQYHSKLQRESYLTDRKCDRKERCEALEVLAVAGFHDLECLLGQS